MKYLWTEDTGAGLHFWKLVNQLFFENALVVESKESNQGILNAVSDLRPEEEDKYYIAFDYVVDNQDIRNKYRLLKSIAEKSNGRIIILDMICFEYLILAYSTERVMKSLVGEFTQNEKWSVKGALMGECWYKNCCISEHPNNLRCGKPETEDGNEKMRMLICSEEIQKLLNELIR